MKITDNATEFIPFETRCPFCWSTMWIAEDDLYVRFGCSDVLVGCGVTDCGRPFAVCGSNGLNNGEPVLSPYHVKEITDRRHAPAAG